MWLDGGQLMIALDCPFGCGSEVWAGEKKGRFFGEVFGVDVRVHQRLNESLV
jgi:hypothetical protein